MFIRKSILCFLVVIFLTRMCWGQIPFQSQTPVFKTEVNLVNIEFSVYSKKTKEPINNFNKENFLVYEIYTLKEGNKERKITERVKISHFYTYNNLNLWLFILVDTSSSIEERLEYLTSITINLIRNFSEFAREKDKIAIAKFFFNTYADYFLNSNTNKIERRIKTIKSKEIFGWTGKETLNRWFSNPKTTFESAAKIRKKILPKNSFFSSLTPLFDAIYRVIKGNQLTEGYFSPKIIQETNALRVIVLISDGLDSNISGTKGIEDAILAIQEYGVLIYAINPFKDGVGQKNLKTLAQKSGGDYLNKPGIIEVSSVFNQIKKDLESRYSIGFTPSNPHAKGRRKIKIEIIDKQGKKQKGFIIHARDSFYVN